ncbi:MAG: hypothetical protein QOJ37_4353, partial [Pseudonocardiales bacterium]|nr:hypothetical protein [Pseudonocardiales bacterium]
MSRRRSSRRLGLTLSVIALSVAGLLAAPAPSIAGAAPQRVAAAAPGAPGSLSRFDLARKDCVGTARSASSKVWFTVAGGVLSDVYEPTIDNTNVQSLQFVVTDGTSFSDLQQRDMTYTVRADATGMECTVTATNKPHKYELVTTYLADPARDTILINTTLHQSALRKKQLRLYARLDAHVNGNGGGGTAN